MDEPASRKTQALIAVVVVQILFGVNYVISKVIVGTIPPLIWAAFRVIVAASALFAISVALKRPRPKLNADFFRHIIPYSLLGVIINQGSFLVGLHYTTPTNSSILNTLIPVFTLLFVTLAGQEKASLRRVIGFILALSGVLALRNVEDFSISNQTLVGDGLTILNCLSYAVFLSVSKKFISTHDTLWITTWMFIFGSMGLTLLSLPSWKDFQLPDLSGEMIGFMIFSILGSTLLAYLLNNWALARLRSSSVALFIYMQPVVASMLAWLWFGDLPTVRTLLSSGLIFVGMVLSLKKAPDQPEPH